MQLDEFITETLKSIIKGIKDSQDFAKDNGSIVNPLKNRYSEGTHIKVGNRDEGTVVSHIEFDIAVTASTKQESGVSGGINVLSLNIGGKTSEIENNQTISRIKFSLEVLLPSSNPFR